MSYNRRRGLILGASLLGSAFFFATASLSPVPGDPAAAPPLPAPVVIPALVNAQTVQVLETWTRYDVGSAGGAGGRSVVLSVTIEQPSEQPSKVRIDESKGGTPSPGVGLVPGTPDALFIVKGETQYEYVAATQQFRKSFAPPLSRGTISSGFHFTQAAQISLLLGQTLPVYTLVGTETNQGRAQHLYECTYHKYAAPALRRLWVDTQTHLPARLDEYETRGGKLVQATRTDFSGWQIDAPLSPDTFAWTPPDGAREYIPLGSGVSPFAPEPAARTAAHPPLLANGTLAPDFTVLDRYGRPVRLSDFRGQAVVLDFWATWCGPCQVSLPHTSELAREYKGKGMVVLAVNVWDTLEAFEAWLPQHPEYASINFAIDTTAKPYDIPRRLYRVWGIPTQYIIGPDGKILAHAIYNGTNEKAGSEAVVDKALWEVAQNG